MHPRRKNGETVNILIPHHRVCKPVNDIHSPCEQPKTIKMDSAAIEEFTPKGLASQSPGSRQRTLGIGLVKLVKHPLNPEGVPSRTHVPLTIDRTPLGFDAHLLFLTPGCARFAHDPGLCDSTPSGSSIVTGR